MVSKTNAIFYDYKGKWQIISGIKAKDIDIDKDGGVWALNMSGELYKLFKGQWQKKSNRNSGVSVFNQVISQNSKVQYARFKDNSFNVFKNGKWKALSGKPLKIAMSDGSNYAAAIGRDRRVYTFNERSNKWVALKGTRKDFSDVAVEFNTFWAIGTDKSIYYYDWSSNNQKETSSIDFSGTYRVYIKAGGTASEGMEFYGTMGVYLNTKVNGAPSSVLPLEGGNRYFNVSKSKPIKVNKKSIKINRPLNCSNCYRTYNHNYSFTIDKVRRFKLVGDQANKNATFDFQFNIKHKYLTGDIGEWERVKLKISEIDFGKEYAFSTESLATIVFKIEKL